MESPIAHSESDTKRHAEDYSHLLDSIAAPLQEQYKTVLMEAESPRKGYLHYNKNVSFERSNFKNIIRPKLMVDERASPAKKRKVREATADQSCNGCITI